MALLHEVRDPIHAFVRFDSQERRAIDSEPVQRLRHIHQLALTHFIYPGATHTRLEHVLGVMELAGRVFDVVTHAENVVADVRTTLPEVAEPDRRAYWRRALRIAALFHDVGHLPFSHAAERALLSNGWDHERLTRDIILSQGVGCLLSAMEPPIRAEDVVKLSLGRKRASDLKFTIWETILSEIVTGDALGVDRMDYLLRDSHHTGVAYGRFDHYRLIDTLRILPSPTTGEPALGIEEGGLQSAEALLWARYQIYSQVYFHPGRRIYDVHLTDFLKAWLPGGAFPTHLEDHLKLTDNEVMSALAEAARDPTKPGHDPAARIVLRKHFRLVYERNSEDVGVNPEAGKLVFEALCGEFDPDNVRHDRYTGRGGLPEFPVRLRGGKVVSSLAESQMLRNMPVVACDSVYVSPEKRERAREWLEREHDGIVKPPQEDTHGET